MLISNNLESKYGASPVKCNKIIGYLTRPFRIAWQIVRQDGKLIYESGFYTVNEAWTIELDTITNISAGDTFHVEVTRSGKDAYSSILLTYTPDSNATVYFEFDPEYSPPSIAYYGVVPLSYSPNANPYLNCTGLIADNFAEVVTKYALYTLDGTLLYESGTFKENGGVWKISFQAIGLTPGTTFRLRSVVSAGYDSVADVIMNYDPTSLYFANLQLAGSATNNITLYKGISKFDIQKCSNIVAYNTISPKTHWDIILLNGLKIYSSNTYNTFDTWKYDLTNLSLPAGTQFLLKSAIDARDDCFSSVVLEYHPATSTAYFELKINSLKAQLSFYGLVPSYDEPPVLICSQLYLTRFDNVVAFRWALINQSGKEVYKGGRTHPDEYLIINLNNLGIMAGEKLRLKAIVIGGKDTYAYITIEYLPDSNIRGYFAFDGNAGNKIILFKGLSRY